MDDKKFSYRINKFMSSKGLNKNSFSRAIGSKNNSSIGRVINGEANPAFITIFKILTKFPELDANWLVTGEGNMLKDHKITGKGNYVVGNMGSCNVSYEEGNCEGNLQSVVLSQKQEIEILKKTINVLERESSFLKEQVAFYKEIAVKK